MLDLVEASRDGVLDGVDAGGQPGVDVADRRLHDLDLVQQHLEVGIHGAELFPKSGEVIVGNFVGFQCGQLTTPPPITPTSDRTYGISTTNTKAWLEIDLPMGITVLDRSGGEEEEDRGRPMESKALSTTLLTVERLGSGGIRSKAGSTTIGKEHMGS